MRLSSKRTIAGVVAAVTLVAGTGAALAHGGPGMRMLVGFGGRGGGAQTDTLNAVAKNLNVSNTALRKAIKDALKAQVDKAVAAGALTKAQGDDAKSRIDSGAVHVGVGPVHMGWGDLGAIDAASAYLGMSVADIRAGLQSGKSLADLAKDKGKTVQGLQDAIVAQAQKNLSLAVSSGDLTSAQSDTILTNVKNNVDDFVNASRGGGLGPGKAMLPGGRMMGFALMGPGRAMHHR